ncbi:glutamine--fructose-6-phosphate transaminase (isomerizing), partial [Candidatus Calescamantes bacterium]|nr:glutamine--fructose-6-phosphate transaminase (isomerizing) [Candidatus Calescamantes bacterium]
TSLLPENVPYPVRIISHTRWATHGKVTIENAHPQLDCERKIALVHNGIIENYKEIKEALEKKGHKFISKTDTEAIAHLIEEYMGRDEFEEAVKKALLELNGSFAVVIMNRDSGKVIGARRHSPLAIGVEGENFFIASDPLSFLNRTKKVIFLEDDEMAIVDKEVEILHLKMNKKREKIFQEINLDTKEIEKGHYQHFMLKEIFEQGEVIENTYQYISNNAVLENIDKRIIEGVEKIVFVGCGTSWHAGLVGEYMIEDVAEIPVEVEYASEFRYRNPVLDERDIVITISQSGETADTLAALREAKKKCRVFSICNVPGSSIARESDYVLYTKAGTEIGVASTKAFTAQLTVLYLLALYLARKREKVSENFINTQRKALEKIPEKIKEILQKSREIDKISEHFLLRNNALFLGRGFQFPIALEGALKLKEVSYIHAEGYPAAEMKHGPIALIDQEMPVVFLAVKDRSYSKIMGNIEEVKARGGFVIALVNDGDREVEKLVDVVISVPETNQYSMPLLTVIPLQLLAYYTALKRGCDVDKPRNLAKSVTVE